MPLRLRLLLVLPAVASLVCGILSGLARLGLPMPSFIIGLIGVHSALMIGGFFGTVISLERAVALSTGAATWWPYGAPLFSGLAAIAMIAGAPAMVAPVLLCLAALIMLIACVSVWLRQKVAHHAVLAMGALAWLVGNIVWALDGMLILAVPLWATFLLLTIAGERLELSRFMPTPPAARVAFIIIITVLLLAATLAATSTLWVNPAALQLFAGALLSLAFWLFRFDIARQTIKSSSLTRYMAVCLLSGFFWLAVAGLLGVCGALQSGAFLHDAALHALLLGFVFSMVFGHAPIILPAVSRLKFRWHPSLYIPLAALHLGLVARLLAGLTDWFALRQYAAIANAIALLLFMLMVVISLSTVRVQRP